MGLNQSTGVNDCMIRNDLRNGQSIPLYFPLREKLIVRFKRLLPSTSLHAPLAQHSIETELETRLIKASFHLYLPPAFAYKNYYRIISCKIIRP